jgi:Polysaccharide biosynthesis
MIPTAVEHLMTYWAILEKVKGSQLRLTKMDDEIYESFMKEFPDFDPTATIDEDAMKSKAGKEKWRNWVNQFEKKIEDFNFGTIIRTRADVEYDQDTTIFGEFRHRWCLARLGRRDWTRLTVIRCAYAVLRH